MRVLLTNDDGIHAPGLAASERIAEALGAETWVVAPMSEMSGVGHCISYTKPVRVEQLGERRFSIDGFPADCVLVALYQIMKEAKPDLVISGVNSGNNIAENTLYSGTLGAAIEGVLHDIPAIALSQFYGPGNKAIANAFEPAEAHGPDLVRALLDKGIWKDREYGVFYNVNFPPYPAAEVKGRKVTFQGRRPSVHFSATAYDAPNLRRYYWIHGGPQHVKAEPGADATANLDGYISITPCRADLTDHAVVDTLANALNTG